MSARQQGKPPAELSCGSPGTVCLYVDGPNESEHLHVHAETWARMREVAEMLEGEDETKGAIES